MVCGAVTLPVVDSAPWAQAAELRRRANLAFHLHNYHESVLLYTRALFALHFPPHLRGPRPVHHACQALKLIQPAGALPLLPPDSGTKLASQEPMAGSFPSLQPEELARALELSYGNRTPDALGRGQNNLAPHTRPSSGPGRAASADGSDNLRSRDLESTECATTLPGQAGAEKLDGIQGWIEREVAALLACRAGALIKLQQYAEALEDCKQAMELDHRNPKVFFRAGLSAAKLSRFEESCDWLKKATALVPGDKKIQFLLEECKSEQERQVLARELKVEVASAREKFGPATLNLITKKLESNCSLLVVEQLVQGLHADACVGEISRVADLLAQLEANLADSLHGPKNQIFFSSICEGYPCVMAWFTPAFHNLAAAVLRAAGTRKTPGTEGRTIFRVQWPTWVVNRLVNWVVTTSSPRCVREAALKLLRLGAKDPSLRVGAYLQVTGCHVGTGAREGSVMPRNALQVVLLALRIPVFLEGVGVDGIISAVKLVKSYSEDPKSRSALLEGKLEPLRTLLQVFTEVDNLHCVSDGSADAHGGPENSLVWNREQFYDPRVRVKRQVLKALLDLVVEDVDLSLLRYEALHLKKNSKGWNNYGQPFVILEHMVEIVKDLHASSPHRSFPVVDFQGVVRGYELKPFAADSEVLTQKLFLEVQPTAGEETVKVIKPDGPVLGINGITDTLGGMLDRLPGEHKESGAEEYRKRKARRKKQSMLELALDLLIVCSRLQGACTVFYKAGIVDILQQLWRYHTPSLLGQVTELFGIIARKRCLGIPQMLDGNIMMTLWSLLKSGDTGLQCMALEKLVVTLPSCTRDDFHKVCGEDGALLAICSMIEQAEQKGPVRQKQRCKQLKFLAGEVFLQVLERARGRTGMGSKVPRLTGVWRQLGEQRIIELERYVVEDILESRLRPSKLLLDQTSSRVALSVGMGVGAGPPSKPTQHTSQQTTEEVLDQQFDSLRNGTGTWNLSPRYDPKDKYANLSLDLSETVRPRDEGMLMPKVVYSKIRPGSTKYLHGWEEHMLQAGKKKKGPYVYPEMSAMKRALFGTRAARKQRSQSEVTKTGYSKKKGVSFKCDSSLPRGEETGLQGWEVHQIASPTKMSVFRRLSQSWQTHRQDGAPLASSFRSRQTRQPRKFSKTGSTQSSVKQYLVDRRPAYTVLSPLSGSPEARDSFDFGGYLSPM